MRQFDSSQEECPLLLVLTRCYGLLTGPHLLADVMHSVSVWHGDKRFTFPNTCLMSAFQEYHILFWQFSTCVSVKTLILLYLNVFYPLLTETILIGCSCLSRSNLDPCLFETSQHEKQAGEQDWRCWAKEDPHGHHHGSPGPTRGEN